MLRASSLLWLLVPLSACEPRVEVPLTVAPPPAPIAVSAAYVLTAKPVCDGGCADELPDWKVTELRVSDTSPVVVLATDVDPERQGYVVVRAVGPGETDFVIRGEGDGVALEGGAHLAALPATRAEVRAVCRDTATNLLPAATLLPFDLILWHEDQQLAGMDYLPISFRGLYLEQAEGSRLRMWTEADGGTYTSRSVVAPTHDAGSFRIYELDEVQALTVRHRTGGPYTLDAGHYPMTFVTFVDGIESCQEKAPWLHRVTVRTPAVCGARFVPYAGAATELIQTDSPLFELAPRDAGTCVLFPEMAGVPADAGVELGFEILP